MPVDDLTDGNHHECDPVAIICGYGSLPTNVARYAQQSGRRVFLVGIEGEADRSIEEFEHQYLNVGQFGGLLKLLKQQGIQQIVLAGGIENNRPEIRKMKLDWAAIRSLPKVMALYLGGDDSLLSGLIKIFEKYGLRVVGAHDIAPGLLSGAGVIWGRKPNKKELANIVLAARACHSLGSLDIGQAAIAEGNRVVALEGVEGTDGMISRINELRLAGRMSKQGKDGVLVKLMKPGQDMRADLPAIGPDTIKNANNAGLVGVAVDAGHSLILEREKTLAAAEKHGLFIYGFDGSQLRSGFDNE